MIVSVPRPNWDPTPPPLLQASVVLPGPKRGDPLAYARVTDGGPNSYEWRKNLAALLSTL
jgi:hypothetical protein